MVARRRLHTKTDTQQRQHVGHVSNTTPPSTVVNPSPPPTAASPSTSSSPAFAHLPNVPPNSSSSPSRPGPPPPDNPDLKGWYQRRLPVGLIPFSSNRGRQIFKEAMNRGGMEGFFALAEQFQTQAEPAYCGPGTLAMVLNALGLDPKRIWKGNWRWFSEEMLETCDIRKKDSHALEGVETHGLSFEEFLFLAECNGARVRAMRAQQTTLRKFRQAIITATSRTDLHLVASFSRRVLGQTGSGHYSPIGGYHAELDLALVMDVARFKYPPYWAPVPLLWKAACAVDEETGHQRGFYLMSKGNRTIRPHNHHHHDHDTGHVHTHGEDDPAIFTPLSSACRIAVDKEGWSRLAEHFCSVLPAHIHKQYKAGLFHPTKAITSLSAPTAASPSNYLSPSALSPSPSLSSLDASAGLVFGEILRSLPVELSSVFLMYTHDLNERMVEQYRRKTATMKRDKHDDHQQHICTCAADVASTDESAVHACNTSSSCQLHSTRSPSLSIYPTLLPANTPHSHTHTIPIVEALHPFLYALEQTPVFHALRKAGVDLRATSNTQLTEEKQDDECEKQRRVRDRFYLVDASAGLEDYLELATLLLYACPKQIFALLPTHLASHIDQLRSLTDLPQFLQVEVRNLRSQMGILAEFCMCGAMPSIQGNDNPNADLQKAHAEAVDHQSAVDAMKHVAKELHAVHTSADTHSAHSNSTAPIAPPSVSMPLDSADSRPRVAHRFFASRRVGRLRATGTKQTADTSNRSS